MNENKMKNMVILKDLPSNIVEEAYVVLKPNQKFKKYIEKQEDSKKEITPDYVVKEAEMVVSNYLSKIEENRITKNLEIEKIEKKYIKIKKIALMLGGIVILNMLSFVCGKMWKNNSSKYLFKVIYIKKQYYLRKVFYYGKNIKPRRKNKKSRGNIL